MGIGLIDLSVLRLLGVVRSGLAELPGLEGNEITSECSKDGSLSVSSEGGGIGEEFSLVSLQEGVSGGGSFDLTELFPLRVLSLFSLVGG